MTHHITGELFQRTTAEHSLPSVGENSRMATSPVVPAGGKALRIHHESPQATGQTLGQGGVLSEHPRAQFLLPDNLCVCVSLERSTN